MLSDRMVVPIILFLVFLNFNFGCSTDRKLSWPEKYYLKGEKIDVMSAIIKPVEIWNNEKFARVDWYNGQNKQFYHRNISSMNIYMINPRYSESDKKTIQECKSYLVKGDNKTDFLPRLQDFVFERWENLNGRAVQVWNKVEQKNGYKYKEQLMFFEVGNGLVLPTRYDVKRFGNDSSLRAHSLFNFYTFRTHVSDEDFKLPLGKCENLTNDFHEVINYLHPSIPTDLRIAFNGYQNHHNKKYSEDELEMRKEIFEENWKLVRDHNSKNLGYALELNKFADRTDEELSYLVGIIQSNRPNKARSNGPTIRSDQLKELNGNSNGEKLPDHFDLRMMGVVSPVRDQANCGSCWAFATVGALETVLARSNGGRLLELSPQSLIDCTWDYESLGCRGKLDNMDGTFQYVAKYGIPTVAEYGFYLEEDGICKIENMTEVYQIKDYVKLTPNDREAMKSAIVKYGPLVVAVYGSTKMKLYKNGIFSDDSCKTQEVSKNHVMVIIGYGHKDGQLYWIVKNTWGESWGMDGYIHMAAKNQDCEVIMEAGYLIL